MTTTKRGIDAGTEVYSKLKDLMRVTTKTLTSFTNKWKKFPEQLDRLYGSTNYIELPELRSLAPRLQLVGVRNMDGMRKSEPKYPEPEQEKTSVRISFSALKVEVEAVR